MLFKLFILFTLFPVLELYFFIKIGGIIGAANTVLIILFTGIIGAILAKVQGLKTAYKITEELNQGRVPAEEIVDAFFIFLGGVLLLTPGFFSDFIGLLVLVPFLRKIIKELFFKIARKKFQGKTIDINLFKGDSHLDD